MPNPRSSACCLGWPTHGRDLKEPRPKLLFATSQDLSIRGGEGDMAMKVVTRDVFVNLLQTRGSEKLQQHLPRYDLEMILGRGQCVLHEGNLTPSTDWRPTTDNLVRRDRDVSTAGACAAALRGGYAM